MPTPSDNQPNSIAEIPPEADDPVVDSLEDVLSPESATAPSVLSRSDDGTGLMATDPVERKMAVDEDTGLRGRALQQTHAPLLPNHSSSFLRSGSRFVGTQQSDRQVYNVDVEIKHVDMAESYLCGYLRIQGLTEDHPTLTTFFEGEIIGTKHTFQTRNEEWGANEKTDIHHWSRFPAWKPLAKQAKKTDFTYRNFAQREHVFMRWKEYFLVPDHRVRTISGASFEGFYYICFNQIQGSVSGVYFHAKSERYVSNVPFQLVPSMLVAFQQLELKHVEDHGCAPAIEFR
ncbi:hypothetical protein N7470_009344 [Penicillium chermesinum]|nr:hypothetical protein N7470_009344 [Penicillium chermesinum]